MGRRMQMDIWYPEDKTLAEMLKYSLEMDAPIYILLCCHEQGIP